MSSIHHTHSSRYKVVRQYVVCRKHSGAPNRAPDPLPLPLSRVKDSPPFTTTGVDFTGALHVKSNGRENKVYICLFTCTATRVAHLEIMMDLIKDTFLQEFRRFVSCRSLPSTMIFDNASTYQSAAEELKKLFKSISLKEALNRQGIQWQLIPKHALWHGGFWECLIGLQKLPSKEGLGVMILTPQHIFFMGDASPHCHVCQLRRK